MKGFIISWMKDWSTAPILDPAACSHPGASSMAIGVEIVRERPGGSGRTTTAATICMLCGVDTSGRMTPADVLDAAWREHGWHESTRDRLLALADRLPAEEGTPA